MDLGELFLSAATLDADAFAGFSNYYFLLTDPAFATALVNTLIIVGGTLLRSPPDHTSQVGSDRTLTALLDVLNLPRIGSAGFPPLRG